MTGGGGGVNRQELDSMEEKTLFLLSNWSGLIRSRDEATCHVVDGHLWRQERGGNKTRGTFVPITSHLITPQTRVTQLAILQELEQGRGWQTVQISTDDAGEAWLASRGCGQLVQLSEEAYHLSKFHIASLGVEQEVGGGQAE